jgi:hypothetical protein
MRVNALIIWFALPSLASAGASDSWDVIANFNLTNSPSGVFTYGEGGTPGAFSLYSRVQPACPVTGIVCADNAGTQPLYSTVTWNGSGSNYSSLTIVQPPDLLRFDPQIRRKGFRPTQPTR